MLAETATSASLAPRRLAFSSAVAVVEVRATRSSTMMAMVMVADNPCFMMESLALAAVSLVMRCQMGKSGGGGNS